MPTQNQIHVDRPLSNISIKYRNADYIADMVAKPVPVKNRTDKYFVYSKDNLRIEDTHRADKAESQIVDFNISTATYSLEKHGLKAKISDDEYANSDEALDLRIDATENLTDAILAKRENTFCTLIGTAANWANTTSLTSTYAWSAYTSLSNPIPFVDSACSAITKNTGKKANTVVMDNATFYAVKEHPSIVDRVKYTSADSITETIIAKLFNIDNLYVSRAIQNSGKEGLADSMGYMMTDCCWIGYVEPAPGLRKPSALYTFFASRLGLPMQTKMWREEEIESDVIEVNAQYQTKIIASDCAYLIVNTVQ